MARHRFQSEDEAYADRRCVECDRHLDRRGSRCRACAAELRLDDVDDAMRYWTTDVDIRIVDAIYLEEGGEG